MKKLSLFTLIIISAFTLRAQDNSKSIAEATNFAVPSSPAFLLLDVNPTKVNKPGFARDFKFDWVFQGEGLAPNIAIEAQPIWLLFYDKTSLKNYQDQDWLPRTLSTLSVSLGTVEQENVSSLAFAFKINLYREADPIMDNAYINKIAPVFSDKNLELRIASLEAKKERTGALDQSEQSEYGLLILNRNTLDEKERERIKEAQKQYIKDNWNATLVDIGYGRSYNYNNANFNNLDFISSGSGLWINACKGFGRRTLISGLLKYTDVARKEQYMGGINFRYGSSKVNFFAECVYENIPGEESKRVDRYTLAYGGDYRIQQNIALQFGVRTEYNKDFNLNQLRPVVNLNYILNKD
ncbi:hypothetical protein AHMF7605_21470 [Adhaeribacter arboris]|uniref:DUF3078 domain-containing protein n=1 Tax=Adhaeribacter arboris TaxID=2072846 RepID=A0A2T2YK46_9BACT|nr:hypothetical protein [Adhaeribacter arboris]PSR55886.1 hypothetical protein AHMF7605_21470 [Adhaeribacter arboris]